MALPALFLVPGVNFEKIIKIVLEKGLKRYEQHKCYLKCSLRPENFPQVGHGRQYII